MGVLVGLVALGESIGGIGVRVEVGFVCGGGGGSSVIVDQRGIGSVGGIAPGSVVGLCGGLVGGGLRIDDEEVLR